MIATARQLEDEIAYFEGLLGQPADGSDGSGSPESSQCYVAFIQRRRQLLAAVEAGRPEAWRDFSAGATGS